MHISITLEPSSTRLDLALLAALQAEGYAFSRSELRQAFDEGLVRTLDGIVPKPSLKLDAALSLVVERKLAPTVHHEAEAIPLDILYEDEDLMVINKPEGMVVHPAPGHADGTLVNALLHHCGTALSDVNGQFRPGIVHRIDKDTSGLLLVAKTNTAHRILAEALARHAIEREYVAVVYGHFAEAKGRIEAPIGRDPQHRQRMKVLAEGKPAVTHFTVLENLAGCTLLRLRLETGRTHQIRVHMQYIHHPVVGDPLYAPGRKDMGRKGQLLHADTLRFEHPRTGEAMEFQAPWPAYLTDFITAHR